MSNAVQKSQNTPQTSIKDLMNSPSTQKRLAEILDKNAATFSTSVIQLVNSNTALQKCDPVSILNSALVATTLNLPINNQLGLAYVVPYGNQATLQLGYRAFLQLAQRSGQFERINACKVYSEDTEETVKQRLISLFPKMPSGNVIGYIAYFKLLNGYEDHLYMSIEEITTHAKKYSQTFKKYGTGLWKDEFEAMAQKTVLKLLLSKKAPLSIEMQRAEIADQAVIKNYDGDTIDADYVDNKTTIVVEEVSTEERQIAYFKDTLSGIMSMEELNSMLENADDFTPQELELIEQKKKDLTTKK